MFRPLVSALTALGICSAAVPLSPAAPPPADRAWSAAFGLGVLQLPAGTHRRPGSRPAPEPARTTTAALSKPARNPLDRSAAPAPAPVPAADEREASAASPLDTAAEQLVATFVAASASGIHFPPDLPKDIVVAALAAGIAGDGGASTETVFKVPGLDATRQARVLGLLSFEGGKLAMASAAPRAPTPPEAPPGDGSRPAPTPPAAAVGVETFAEGWLQVSVPRQFAAEPGAAGELVLRSERASLTLKLERYGEDFDPWSAVRQAADGAGLGASMAGKNVYVILPDRRNPERVLAGVGQALVAIEISGGAEGSGDGNLIRLTLPTIVETLALAR